MSKQVPCLIRLAYSKAGKGTNVGAQMGHLKIMLVLLVFDLQRGLVLCVGFIVNVGGGKSTRCLE